MKIVKAFFASLFVIFVIALIFITVSETEKMLNATYVFVAILKSLLIAILATLLLMVFGIIKDTLPLYEGEKPLKKLSKVASLKNQAVLVFTLLSVVPLVTLGVFYSSHMNVNFKNEVLQKKMELVQWTNLEMAHTFKTIQSELLRHSQTELVKDVILENYTLENGVKSKLVSDVSSAIHTLPVVRTEYLDAGGVSRLAVDHGALSLVKEYKFRPITSLIIEQCVFKDEADICIVKDKIGDSWEIDDNNYNLYFIALVLDGERDVGYVVQHVPMNLVFGMLSSLADEPYVILADMQGVHCYSPVDCSEQSILREFFLEWSKNVFNKGSGGTLSDNAAHYTLYSILKMDIAGQDDGMILAINVPKNVASDRLVRYSHFLILFIIGVAVLAIGLSVLVAGWWSRPLLELAAIAERLRGGDYSARVTVSRDDEIGFLGATFNRMAEQIARYTEKMEYLVEKRTVQYNEQRKKAEAISDAKSRFLENLSRELRTPMNGILGASKLLLDSGIEVNENTFAFATMINESSRSLLSIVDDVILFSQIENGVVEIDSAPFELSALIHEVYDEMKEISDAKKLDFILTSSPDMQKKAVGDAEKIKGVLRRLVMNAIKFTNHGRVTLRCSCETKDGNLAITFEVEDTGIGIAEDKVGTVFFSFYQHNDSVTDMYSGIRLGLAICQGMAELMGGVISFQSTLGAGSTFVMDLTLEEYTKPLDSPSTDTGGANGKRAYNKKVLIVEDNLMNQKVLQKTLEKMAIESVIVENGSKALEAVRKNHFDLILMDVQMPVMDGITATKKMRGEMGVATPIVAITAKAFTEDRKSCISAGMNGFVSKPVMYRELVKELDRWLEV